MKILQLPRPVWDSASGAASNNFSPTNDPTAVVANCHRCQCDELFPQVMAKVLRVRDVCQFGNVCELDNYSAFRRRNMAVSRDYARVFLAPSGNRLKFAGAASLGSTLAGFGMDIAVRNLQDFGQVVPGSNNSGLNLPDNSTIIDDGDVGIAEWLSGVSWQQILTGLRRLSYGNLAIYMDLGLTVNFCQMHEERFGYFRQGKVDEFIACWEKFVDYVKNEHSRDHPVYAAEGSFGYDPAGQNYVNDAIKAIAQGDVEGSLVIIDHEQRTIAQNMFYAVENSSMITDPVEKNMLGSDLDFKIFMNALERVQSSPLLRLGANMVEGYSAANGIYAAFSAERVPLLLCAQHNSPAGSSLTIMPSQPLIYFYERGDFTLPDERVPWFKEVMHHFLQAENNTFRWPEGGLPMGGGYVLVRGGTQIEVPTNTKELLYGEIRRAGMVS